MLKRSGKINITIVCWGFSHSSLLRQPWRYIYEISRGMTELGANVTIVSYGVQNEVKSEKLDGVNVRYYCNSTLSFLLTNKFIRAIMNEKPDIILLIGTPIVVALSRLQKVKKPVVWYVESDFSSLKDLTNFSFREFFINNHWSSFLHLLVQSLFPKVVIKNIANSRLLEKVVAPNDFVKRSLMNIGVFQEKIAVISSTIDKEAFRRTFSNSLLDDFREELCYSSSDFIITYLGSPCTLRGTDTIIKSVKKVSEKTHKIRAILLCRGNRKEELFLSHLDEKEYLSRLIDKLEIKPYVRLVTGILGKGQLSKYLSISDAIVLPFKTLIAENPLAPLEAMSLGKLVIVTKVGSLSELVGGNKGISIRANDANELSKVILYAINHPERSKELANNARNFAANLPDWEEVAQTTLTLLARAHASFETKLCKHRGVK